jgi:predicted DNA-binding protein (MmcQ/YjbR family)
MGFASKVRVPWQAGDHLLDIAFPRPVRDELVAASEVQPHHVLPDSGWVSFYLKKEEDVEHAAALLRRSYDLAREQQERKYGGQSGPARQ